MDNSTRVVFNTGILYAKLLVGLIIGLFTTRLVLDALGETNYGIYILVAGVIGMLGILNSSMSAASMRFMSHSLGSNNEVLIKKTFNTTLLLHFFIGLVVVLFMEIGGILMFEYVLNIPVDKIFDAKIVFHFMVITTFVTIISVPYDAVINSHENLFALSVVDVIGYLLKLVVAIYLTYSSGNLLVLYGALILIVQIVLRVIKQWYSRVKYDECKIQFRKFSDKKIAKEILSFSGWNLFGSIAAIAVRQVRGILLNSFFGVSINAADGISKTASTQVNTVSSSMTRALNPQLMKSEGGGDRKRMLRLTELSTKFSVFLFALFAIPVISETPYLLNLWLKDVPKFASIFCQLLLIGLFIEKFSFEITTAIRAVGKIRQFQIIETTVAVLFIPLAYLVFKMGGAPYTIFLVNILLALLAFWVRLYFGQKITNLSITSFFNNAIFPLIVPLLICFSMAFGIRYFLSEGILRLATSIIINLVMLTFTFWIFSLKKEESNKLYLIFKSFLSKFKSSS